MVFLLYCIGAAAFNTKREDLLPTDSCIVDYTFVWTDNVNQFLIEHKALKNMYIIYASFMMDLMLLSLQVIFVVYARSVRI
jgi:hypothetical protein